MRAVAVIIPARNEEAALPAALASVEAAARAVDLPVTTVVACDSCSDRTAEVARAAGAHVVQTTSGCAGGARSAAVAASLALLPDVPQDKVWVASTDADSLVGVDWLTTHLSAAERGWDAYAGEILVPDWSGWHDAVSIAYERRYRRPGRRPPVHGANLGVRLDAYLAVGGFPAFGSGEDQMLVERLTFAGYGVLSSSVAPVHTSARRVARALGGFSGYLQALELEILPDRPAREIA